MKSPVNTSKEPLWSKVGSRLRGIAGRILESVHVPARIREFEYIDPVTNETVYLSTGARYSVLHVGGKQYFFERLTGRFDGTGALLVEGGVADGFELSNQPNF